MKVTNKTGLPDVIYRAMKGNEYTRGDARYSISDLINPPQIRVLREKHSKDIVEDIQDRQATFIGTAVHEKLERDGAIPDKSELMEERLFAMVNGIKISGALDHYHCKKYRILDYKVTKASKIVWADYTDWTNQLNCYGQLRRSNGYIVESLLIIAFLKDWEAKQAEMDKKYPQYPIVQVPIELWSEEQAAAYLHERVKIHTQADEDLSYFPCSDSERWMRNLRCKKYCNVSKWCEQYRLIKEGR